MPTAAKVTPKTPVKRVVKSKSTESVPAPSIKRAGRGSKTTAVATTTESGLVQSYVPDPEVAKRYIGRRIFGVWDYALVTKAMKNGENILLSGPTGAGKTMLGEAFAAKHGFSYYSLPCDVAIDPSSLFGKFQPTNTPGKFVWQDGPVTSIVRNGGVLNLSEINFMLPKVAAALYSLLDSRRYLTLLGHEGEVVPAHPDLVVIADMNPGYRGTMELNAAFKNRFSMKFPWDYDDDVEKQLVGSATLRSIVSNIRAMMGTEIMTPVATNMMIEFEAFAKDADLGLDFAIGNFVSAFDPDEQQAVNKVMNELGRANLARDMAQNASDAFDDDDIEDASEDVEFEMEV